MKQKLLFPDPPLAPASPSAQGHQHRFLPGTAYLGTQLQKMGATKFLVAQSFAFLIPGALILAIVVFLVLFIHPYVASGLNALGGYQPTIQMWTGHIGAPGESIQQQTRVIATYGSNLEVIVAAPDGSSVTAAAPPELVENPHILSVSWSRVQKEITVIVETNWKTFGSTKIAFVFSYSGGKLKYMALGQG